MDDIVSSVKRVTDIMGEITAASQEQSAGIEQVNRAIAQMDQMTQQNASLVEQAAAAAESMKGQADTLTQAVRVFKVGAPSGQDRRGPDRPVNVSRMPKAANRPAAKPRALAGAATSKATTPTAKPGGAAATGTRGDDGWEQF